jgi:hypothetical protein
MVVTICLLRFDGGRDRPVNPTAPCRSVTCINIAGQPILVLGLVYNQEISFGAIPNSANSIS